MEETEIREKIRNKLQTGRLQPDMGSLIVGGSGGSGQSCAACDQLIRPSEPTPVAYEYASELCYWFHRRCEELWQEERLRPRRRN